MKNKILRILIYLFFIVFLVCILLFKTFPNYLIFSQKPEKADIILIISGDADGTRLIYGVSLYRLGYSHKIFLTGGIMYKGVTWSGYKKELLLKERIPSENILLEDKSSSTLEEAKYSFEILKKLNIKSIILVTNDFHSRRAYNVFKKVYKNSGIKIISCPAKSKEINIKEWWKDNYSSEIYFTEIIKTIWYMIRHGIH